MNRVIIPVVLVDGYLQDFVHALKDNSIQPNFHNPRRLSKKEKERMPSPHKAQRLGCRAFVQLRRQAFDFVGAAPFTGGDVLLCANPQVPPDPVGGLSVF